VRALVGCGAAGPRRAPERLCLRSLNWLCKPAEILERAFGAPILIAPVSCGHRIA